jgi:hypothetical protein
MIPDPTYTPDPADVELVADALARIHCWDGLAELEVTAPDGAEPERADARAVLAALAAAGRLVPADAETRTECEINWTDVRSSRPGAEVYGESYNWPSDQFGWWLAREIDAEAHRHRAPVDMRKRTVRTWPDGARWVGPWLPVPADSKITGWCACKPGTTCGYHLANPGERP